MTQYLTAEERTDIEDLIRSFDNHGCGNGFDIRAQVALRRLLNVLEEAEQVIERYEAAIGQNGKRPRSFSPICSHSLHLCVREAPRGTAE